ncbi:MAG: hypothetical protein N2B06_16865 [Clostridium sp.]
MNSILQVFLVLGANALGIIIYFAILSSKYGSKEMYKYDFMNKKLIDLPITKNCCSAWPLSHFVAFTIYSIIWPQHRFLLFSLGVLWEIIEVAINVITKSKHQTTRSSDDVEYAEWWSGSSKDIVFNSMGILLGKFIIG